MTGMTPSTRTGRHASVAVLGRSIAWVLMAAALACRGSAPRSPNGGRSDLNVVFITLDTTRADRIGAYGFPSAGTPNIDRVAHDGVLFEQAESVSSLTLPAHCSLFTGRFPFEHQVRDNGVPLPEEERTLAQILHEQGLRTGAFTAAFVLDGRWGLARGFDVYDGPARVPRTEQGGRGSDRRAGNEVVSHAVAWLESIRSDRFFAWLHFYDAHAPYDAADRTTRPPGYQPAISFMDAQIGRVLAFLDAQGIRDHTVIIIVGDHGESLGDHGELTHGLFVYESVTRVPLIIEVPDDKKHDRRVNALVRSVDVVPTILDLLEIPSAASLSGKSLAPLITGEKTRDRDLEAYSETMYPRDHFGWSDLRAIRSGRFKFIVAPRPELYDLWADSAERVNLYDTRRTLAAKLADALRALQERNPDHAVDALDPEVAARLSAVGYVGHSDARASNELPLADPKDKLPLYLLMTTDRTRDVPNAAGSIPHRRFEVFP